MREEQNKGRPSKYHPQAKRIMLEYYDRYSKLTRKNVPFIEELCMELEIDESTLWRWAKKYEFCKTYIGRLKALQKLRLMQRCLYKESNVFGEIFLLKSNHEMMEAEKRQSLPEEDEISLRISVIDETGASDPGKTNT